MALYLPYDILHLIAELLYLTANLKDLAVLCRVSKDYHDAAIPWLYRRAILHMDKTRQTRALVQQIMAKRSAMVRHVHVPYGPSTTDPQFELLQLLLRGPLALETFTWHYRDPAPDQLLGIVGQIPSLRGLRLFYNLLDVNENFPPPALKDNIKLDELQLSIKSPWVMDQCKKMILQSPGLRYLVVKMRCPGHLLLDVEPLNFLFKSHETLPPLRMLTLQKYDMGVGGPDSIENRLQTSKLEGLILVKCLLLGLTIFFDNLRARKNHLSALKVYKCKHNFSSSEFEEWHASLNGFLQSFKGLESLTLVDAAVDMDCLYGGITHHGQSLRHLILQSSDFSTAQNCLPKSLQSICETCPNLRFLSIDLFRSIEDLGFENSMMEILQKFPALKSLQIQTPLGHSSTLLVKPIVDYDVVRQTALKLQSPTLKKIVIHVGEKITITQPCVWNEAAEWRNWHRKQWVVKYDNGHISMKDLASVEEAATMIQMTDFLGLPFNPPDTWNEFTYWKKGLLQRSWQAKR